MGAGTAGLIRPTGIIDCKTPTAVRETIAGHAIPQAEIIPMLGATEGAPVECAVKPGGCMAAVWKWLVDTLF